MVIPDQPAAAPDDSINGRRFEQLIKRDGDRAERLNLYKICKYGLNINWVMKHRRCKACGSMESSPEPMALPSLPDFEGVFSDGRGLIFEAKVSSGSGFQLAQKDKLGTKQLQHLMDRSTWNEVTFLLVHFNRRQLTKSIQPAQTFAVPVHPNHPFWRRFKRGEEKTLNRQLARDHGVEVSWFLDKRTLVPDLYAAMIELVHLLRECAEREGMTV
jgi:penicillin-binding protein-related factor A (putative recombinase)